MRRVVPEYERIPRGYGVAYHDFTSFMSVCYPFGAHLIVRWARDAYLRLARARPTRLDWMLAKARAAGYKDGKQVAEKELLDVYARGFQDGWAGFGQEVRRRLEDPEEMRRHFGDGLESPPAGR